MIEIGPYNVIVYEKQVDPVFKRTYRLCEIQEFVKNTMIRNNFVYLVSDLKGYVNGFFQDGLKQISVLEKLINMPKNSRVTIGHEYTVKYEN